MKERKKHHFLVRGLLKIGSLLMSVLAIPTVRNWVWNKVMGKAKQKIVDAEARVVRDEKREDKKLF